MSQTTPSGISSIEDIVSDIKQGKMVILVDDEDRENEGDIIIAAERVTPEAINFMAMHARGRVCLTITEARARQLGLGQMVRDNTSPLGTAFTVSIEAAEGISTGISAADRATTVRAAVAPNAKPEDLVQPGHVFPVTARNGGVLVRAGHTEAGCDLSAMAGFDPSSVICEVMNDDGSMARLPDLLVFAQKHGLKVGTIADLISYRNRTEKIVERVSSKPVSLAYGDFELHTYRDRISGDVHFALSKGVGGATDEVVVRVHEQVSVLDFIDPSSTHHTYSFDQAMKVLADAPAAVMVLLKCASCNDEIQRLVGAPAAEKPAAVHWDPRLYGIGAQILRDLGVKKMKLLATPRRMPSMTGFGLELTGFVA